jgi:hypothetical protein
MRRARRDAYYGQEGEDREEDEDFPRLFGRTNSAGPLIPSLETSGVRDPPLNCYNWGQGHMQACRYREGIV